MKTIILALDALLIVSLFAVGITGSVGTTQTTTETTIAETTIAETTSATNAEDTTKETETECDCTESNVVSERLYTDDDVAALARMLYGEARGCEYADQRNCCITVCNRVDDYRWADTVREVIEQPYQYQGYSANNPVCDDLKEIAETVLNDWSLKKQGVSVEWNDYNSFWGDGKQNHYYVN